MRLLIASPLLSGLACVHSVAQEPPHAPATWDFRDPSFRLEATVGCTVRIEEGRPIGQAVKGSPAVYPAGPFIAEGSSVLLSGAGTW